MSACWLCRRDGTLRGQHARLAWNTYLMHGHLTPPWACHPTHMRTHSCRVTAIGEFLAGPGAAVELVAIEAEQPLANAAAFNAYATLINDNLEALARKESVSNEDLVRACAIMREVDNGASTCIDYIIASVDYETFLGVVLDFRELLGFGWEDSDGYNPTPDGGADRELPDVELDPLEVEALADDSEGKGGDDPSGTRATVAASPVSRAKEAAAATSAGGPEAKDAKELPDSPAAKADAMAADQKPVEVDAKS